MGCDIHLFIEYKIGDEPWQADKHHHTLDEDKCLIEVTTSHRNYRLFEALAGVRGYGGSDPKDLPNDVSEIIYKEAKRWNVDGHSHSYSSLKEFEDALKKLDYDESSFNVPPIAFFDYRTVSYDTYGYDNLIAYCRNQVQQLKIDLEVEKVLLGQDINTNVECRLIYWFDN